MRLLELAATVPWAMTEEALDAMLRIAARDPLPVEETTRRMHGRPQTVTMQPGVRRDDSARMRMREGVAIIPIDGPIYRYADMFTEASGGVTTELLARDLQIALDDPATIAILFVVDSPGGEAIGINELADAIAAARAKKPIGCYIEGYGASAAYWLASAADVIGLDATALVGSIGTVMTVLDPGQGVSRRIEFVSKQSPKKRVDPTSEAGRSTIQALVDDLTEVFIAAVMRHRGLTYEQVTALQGGMAIGQQAITAGLADMLTSEEAMVQEMRQRGMQSLGLTPMSLRQQQEGSMKFWQDMFRGMFSAAKEEGVLTDDTTIPITPPTTEVVPSVPVSPTAPTADVAALQQQLAAVQQEARTREATLFAEQVIAAGQALPAERQAIVQLYIQAASLPTSDVLLPQIKAAYAARTPHLFTTEVIPAATAVGVVTLDRGASDDQAVVAAALQSTTLGRATLAKRRS